MHELIFQAANTKPAMKEQRETFLVIHPGDGFCLGRAYYDEDGEFVCFLVDGAFGESEALHLGQYLSWASLPIEHSILESLFLTEKATS